MEGRNTPSEVPEQGTRISFSYTPECGVEGALRVSSKRAATVLVVLLLLLTGNADVVAHLARMLLETHATALGS